MCIRHLEKIFSIDKIVPVDELTVFQQILLQYYLSRCVFTEATHLMLIPTIK